MRKALCTVPVLLCLFCLALPLWGEVPPPPAGSPAAKICSTSAVILPALQPPPLFATTVCGSCGDAACNGTAPGGYCGTPENPGTCFGLAVGGHPLLCSGGGYQCTCLYLSPDN